MLGYNYVSGVWKADGLRMVSILETGGKNVFQYQWLEGQDAYLVNLTMCGGEALWIHCEWRMACNLAVCRGRGGRGTGDWGRGRRVGQGGSRCSRRDALCMLRVAQLLCDDAAPAPSHAVACLGGRCCPTICGTHPDPPPICHVASLSPALHSPEGEVPVGCVHRV